MFSSPTSAQIKIYDYHDALKMCSTENVKLKCKKMPILIQKILK